MSKLVLQTCNVKHIGTSVGVDLADNSHPPFKVNGHSTSAPQPKSTRGAEGVDGWKEKSKSKLSIFKHYPTYTYPSSLDRCHCTTALMDTNQTQTSL